MDRYRSLNTLDNAFNFDFLRLHLFWLLLLSFMTFVFPYSCSYSFFLIFYLMLELTYYLCGLQALTFIVLLDFKNGACDFLALLHLYSVLANIVSIPPFCGMSITIRRKQGRCANSPSWGYGCRWTVWYVTNSFSSSFLFIWVLLIWVQGSLFPEKRQN